MSFEFRQEIRARLDKIEEMLKYLVNLELEGEEDMEIEEDNQEINKQKGSPNVRAKSTDE